MDLGALLAERARRRAEAEISAAELAKYQDIAAELRAWYGDKQRQFFRVQPDARKATLKTRRAGVTSGGVREFLARALEQPGWRGRYVNEIREEAKGLAWRSDTKSGFLDVIDRLVDAGKLKVADARSDLKKGADLKIDEQALIIDFRNGSQIKFFCADDAKSQERGRGGAPHVLWVDEVQKYPNLENFIESIFGPGLLDNHSEVWLTGTVSEWLEGYFYNVTRDDDLSLRLPGWDVLDWSVIDNPFFGATPEERWAATGGKVIAEKKLDPDNLPAWFKREWLAKWIKTDARFVYSIERWPEPVEFAPLRTTPIAPEWLKRVNPEGADPGGTSGFTDRWYDHAASVRDLPSVIPGTNTAIDWFFGLWLDFGYNPDPFAIGLWAFSPSWPELHEMWSWQRTLVLPDWQRDAARWFFDNVSGIVHADGDPGGQAGANMEGWRELLGMPIEDADKAAKRTWIELMNNDGERGRIKLRSGSPLGHGMRHLTWKKVGSKLVENADRKLSDGTVPGNHSNDGALYGYRRLISSRRLEVDPPPPVQGTPEWYAAEAKEMRDAAAAASRRMMEESDDSGPYGSY